MSTNSWILQTHSWLFVIVFFSSGSFSTDWLYFKLWLVEFGRYNVRDANRLPSILLRDPLRDPSQDHELERISGLSARGAHFRISKRDNQKIHHWPRSTNQELGRDQGLGLLPPRGGLGAHPGATRRHQHWRQVHRRHLQLWRVPRCRPQNSYSDRQWKQ